jgi:asparagine synthase (glutamine-hydrolysing)
MSAIGGILMFDGGPVDPSRLTALGVGLEWLGPDGGREVIAGSIGMSYRAFHTNAESRREHQPHCWGHQMMLCWDGRLDNRDELLTLLRDDLRGEDTDAAIVMAAYRRWGDLSLGKLLGDFALAVWDKRHHSVWLARDAVGTRPLYFQVDAERLLWATDLGALLEVGDLRIEVDDEYVAGRLTRGQEVGLTPYVGVHEVKPGHAMRVGCDGLVSERRFWSLDLNREIRYSMDAEYEEHFRALFRESVRARLRSDVPVFAELSGGLDSSAIVCVADTLVKSRAAEAPALETVSYVFEDAPTADEQRWIAHVDEWRGTSGYRIRAAEHPYFRPLRDSSHTVLPTRTLCSSAYAVAMHAAMQEHGARRLLTGIGGDELLHSFQNPAPDLADLVASGQLSALHTRLQIWSRAVKRPYLRLLWNDALLPNLPLPIQARWRSDRMMATPDWLDQRFVSRMRLRERAVQFAEFERSRTPSANIQARNFYQAVRGLALDGSQEIGARETAYPYLDRRLVEYLQAIPFEQKIRPGQNRSIMRRALRGMVPEPILARRDKGKPTELVVRALVRESEAYRRLLLDARIIARGYVDGQKFRAAFERFVTGHEVYSGLLTLLLTIEVWLRAVESRHTPNDSTVAAGVRAAGAVAIPHPATH